VPDPLTVLDHARVTTKLFAYGTLRRGEQAHGLLAGARLLAKARTAPCFTLFDMGGYPALVQGGSTAVLGEIYEIDPALLEALDRYEEAPEVFQRTTIEVAGSQVLAYLLPAERAAGNPLLPDGDWCSNRRQR
jgi:gamma-glutamylcyclotransferase (GGCT)/AIG2-like uncharacterized protein YtfP